MPFQGSGGGLAEKPGYGREAEEVGEVGLLAAVIVVGEFGECRSPVDPFEDVERVREMYGRGGGRRGSTGGGEAISGATMSRSMPNSSIIPRGGGRSTMASNNCSSVQNMR